MPDDLGNESIALAMGKQFDINALIETSQIIAGSFEPLESGTFSRFQTIIAWLNAQPPLRPEQRREGGLQIRKVLSTRMRLAADRARIPAIAAEKIDRPIFVIGFARTGTTLTHSLLAEDPASRAPEWWHTCSPSPPPGEVEVTPQRLEYAARELDEMIRIAPGLLTLHPYWDKREHSLLECEQLFSLDFINTYPTLWYNLPRLMMIDTGHDKAAAYRFHHDLLQHLQWNREPRRWVLKGIWHQFALKELFDRYPDALCIWPHRDPVEVHPSTMAITAALYGGITDWEMDFRAFGPEFVKAVAADVNQMMDSPLVDDPRIIHVNFKELTRDPVDVIRRAYAYAGLDYTSAFEQGMRNWLADPANASNRYGRYNYVMEPFGLDREIVEQAFDGYSRRFKLGRYA